MSLIGTGPKRKQSLYGVYKERFDLRVFRQADAIDVIYSGHVKSIKVKKSKKNKKK